MTEAQLDESEKKEGCLKGRKIPWYTWIILAAVFFLVFKPILLVIYRLKNKSTSKACTVRGMKYNMPEVQQDILPDIYFLDSRCKQQVLPFHACAIESACMKNPWATVALKTFGTFIAQDDPYTNILKNISNFRLLPLRQFDRVGGTAIHSWLLDGFWEKHNSLHFKYAMAYLELYRDGGIYIDSDTVTLKSLRSFKNKGTIAKFNATVLKNGFLSASKRKDKVWRDALVYFQNTDWEEGEGFVTGGRLLADILNALGCRQIVKAGGFCEPANMTIEPEEKFYPLPEDDWPYETKDFNQIIIEKNSYMVFLWNGETEENFSRNQSMLYNVLAKEHCPKVYEASIGQVQPGT